MNKPELVKEVAKRSGCTEKDAGKCVTAMIDAITESLRKRESVTIVGFGSFSVSHRDAREAKNPRTGEKITIEAKNVPIFKAGKGLKDAVL